MKMIMSFLKIFVILILIIVVYFLQPYSPIKSDYNKLVADKISELNEESGQVYTDRSFKPLPDLLKKYLNKSGFLGQRRHRFTKMQFHNVPFGMGIDKPKISMDYQVLLDSETLDRYALIQSSMFGLPFEGIDKLSGRNQAQMKGQIAKALTVFDVQSESLVEGSIVTVLLESIFNPEIILHPDINWEQISDHQVQVSYLFKDKILSGVFTFDSDGWPIQFNSNDRKAVGTDGKEAQVPFTAKMGNYQEKSGVYLPQSLSLTWRYSERDFEYFKAHAMEIEFIP